ncbi:MAG TPA: CBS domain-containing protein [Candidatus Polarisedimenticolia bacterium]|nr:CBS domain-containing protein [Candidatus Polarisedimenticolia bacterium]
MRLEQIMKHPVKTIAANATVVAAREMMREAGVRHLVVMEEFQIAGVVSDRDLGPAGATRNQPMDVVGQRMTPHPITALPTTTVREAANLMRGRRIGCLPVVDEKGRLNGIVTVTDFLDLIGRGAEAPSPRKKRAILTRRGPRAQIVRPVRGRG